jgi:hypothetical protein
MTDAQSTLGPSASCGLVCFFLWVLVQTHVMETTPPPLPSELHREVHHLGRRILDLETEAAAHSSCSSHECCGGGIGRPHRHDQDVSERRRQQREDVAFRMLQLDVARAMHEVTSPDAGSLLSTVRTAVAAALEATAGVGDVASQLASLRAASDAELAELGRSVSTLTSAEAGLKASVAAVRADLASMAELVSGTSPGSIASALASLRGSVQALGEASSGLGALVSRNAVLSQRLDALADRGTALENGASTQSARLELLRTDVVTNRLAAAAVGSDLAKAVTRFAKVEAGLDESVAATRALSLRCTANTEEVQRLKVARDKMDAAVKTVETVVGRVTALETTQGQLLQDVTAATNPKSMYNSVMDHSVRLGAMELKYARLLLSSP